MSRPYRLMLLTKTTTGIKKDFQQIKVKFPPILEDSEMKLILEQVLEKIGWTKKADSLWKLEIRSKKEYIEFDVQELFYTTYIAKDVALKQSANLLENASKAKIHQSQEKLAEQLEQETKKILKNELEKNKETRNRKLNEILYQTYAKALQEKAKKMGQITSVSENKEKNELVIKIKV